MSRVLRPLALDRSRRRVLAQTLSAGFALAVQPIAASAELTDDSGLDAGPIEIPVPPGNLPGYRAVPRKPSGKLPVILVVHEIFGVHEHIRDVCRRLAKQGYFAIAPELFYRHGDVSKPSDVKEVQAIVGKAADRQVMSDLDATVALAKLDPRANAARLGITGFCWGGRTTWLYATHNPDLKAGVAWYGRLTGERSELRPRFPLDVVSDLRASVLGLYGGKDQGIPLDDVEAMKKALSASTNPKAKASTIHVYPEAGHAFLADYRPSFHAASAKDGWKRQLAWFKQHGL
jgi:carboxymethylenebutenolidase